MEAHAPSKGASGTAKAIDKTVGKMQDRTKVIAVKVGGSDTKDVDVAIIKATNHNKVTPKEKHVQTLVRSSQIGDQLLIQHICAGLSKRAHTVKKWLIALKACITYHRLIRESGPVFVEAASAHHHSTAYSLGLGAFRDTFTKPAWDFSAFVRAYSSYIDQQVDVYSFIQYYPEQESAGTSSKFRDMEAAVMVEQVPHLIKLVKAVTLCKPQNHARMSPIVQYAMILVLKECILMYKSCSEAMLNIVDKFFDLEQAQAKQLLPVYKDTIAASQQLVAYMQECRQSNISQGVDLPADLRTVPDDFLQQMDDYAQGRGAEPPIYESPVKVETPKAETPPKEETPKAETPKPESPPKPPTPREIPDLMCLDTPTASEPKSPAKPVEEEDDELGALWKEPTPTNGAHAPPNGFGASQTGYQTGYIQTKAFLAGPTGMTAPIGHDPFSAAPASNNPFLMPVQTAPPPQQTPQTNVYNQGKGVTNVLGDLSVDALGIRKPQPVETAKKEPMRKNTSPSLHLPAPQAPKPASPPAASAPASTPSPTPAMPLIPPNPFYQPPANAQVYNQQLALTGQHDPFAAHFNEDTHAPAGMAPHAMPPHQYSGGVTGYNQAVGYGPGPQPHGSPERWGQPQWQAPPAQPQWQAGFTGAPHQSAVYGANPTGMPAQPHANQFRSAVTGPAQSNPFGSNAFGGNAF